MLNRALLALTALGALLAGALASAALAAPTTYEAPLLPTPGNAAAGAAVLVDGPAADELTVTLQGLAPGAAYHFHVHETKAPGDPCLTPGATEPHVGWEYGPLVADAQGLAVGRGTAQSFTLHADETYFVDVETPAGGVVACGVLKPGV